MSLFQKIKLALALKKAQKEFQMKGWLESKTIVAILGAAVPILSHITGIGAETLTGLIPDIASLGALAIAIYGRIKAKTPVAPVPVVLDPEKKPQ